MPKGKKQVCFVIAPIGPKDSDIRKRSDQVLRHIFKKALAKKYEVKRGDEIDEPGMITSQVLRAVQDSELVVADLTGHNPNVMYELAVRHAIEKPVIHVIEPKLSKIPFDIAGFRTIEFDLTDPDSIDGAVKQLKNHAKEAENGNWGETPVKLANIMQRSKGDSAQMLLLKEAVAGISELRARFSPVVSSQFAALSYPSFTTRLLALQDLAPKDLSVVSPAGFWSSHVFETPVPDGAPATPAASSNAVRDRVLAAAPEKGSSEHVTPKHPADHIKRRGSHTSRPAKE